MIALDRTSPSLTANQIRMFGVQPSWVKFIFIERQVGTDRLIYTITYPHEFNTQANRNEFQVFANSQVARSVQNLADNPLPSGGPNSDPRPIQPIADIGKSL